MLSYGGIVNIEGNVERLLSFQANSMSANEKIDCGLTILDEVSIPYVMRKSQAFVPVRVLEHNFLSKYMNAGNLTMREPLPSYYLSEAEATSLTNLGQSFPFTTSDLMVSLAGFVRFYENVKKTCTILSKPTGGWVQINNTIAPFVVKDESKMVALSIVRCAAGLLIDRAVPTVYPNEAECEYLNISCNSVGIKFEFTTTTELVELVLVECMSEETPVIRVLPEGDPFEVAQFLNQEQCVKKPTTLKDLLESELDFGNVQMSCSQDSQIFDKPFNHSESGLLMGSLVKVIQPISESSDLHRYAAPIPEHIGEEQSILKQMLARYSNNVLNPFSTSTDIPSHMNSSYQTRNLSCGKETSTVGHNIGPPIRLSVSDQSCGMSKEKVTAKTQWPSLEPNAVMNNSNHEKIDYNSNIQPERLIFSMANSGLMNSTATTHSYPLVQRTTLLGSATDEEKQLMASSEFRSSSDSFRAGKYLQLCRVHCFGKTISCMIKNMELHILLEAMNRLYFPLHKLDVICRILENLGVNFQHLTEGEEKDFVKFYKLPAHRLNCNKTITVRDFMNVYVPLSSILNSSEFFPTDNERARGVIPVKDEMTSVLHNQKLALSSLDLNIPKDTSENDRPNLSQISSGVTCGVIPNNKKQAYKRSSLVSVNSVDICADYSETDKINNNSQKSAKRSRMRVIGDVICIDD